MFNNKLTLVADYFIDTRTDLLIRNIPVSGISGGQAPELQILLLMQEQFKTKSSFLQILVISFHDLICL
jgi:hypothetical protein